jgi:hypothetical protein
MIDRGSWRSASGWFVVVAAIGLGGGLPSAAGDDSAAAVFERRIMPIFRSPNPSSCTQCHLAAVDLKNYILPSHEKTFLSLRDQGLIDVANPDESKILKLINMRDPENAGAELIHEKTRQAEYEAFASWIKACVADPQLVGAAKLTSAELARPKRPPEVIRHARKDRLLESFENNIWAMRFRCMSCHIEGTKENDKFRNEYGDRVAWIKSAGAEATMNYLVSTELIDVRNPDKSLLLLKPLKAVEHGGGKKFIVGDQGYKAFRTWLEDYAKTVGDKYPTAAALPKIDESIERFGSNVWIKLTNTAPEWGEALLQADVYTWDASRSAWEPSPIATTDRPNNPKGRLWQHTLTLLAAKDSPRAADWTRGKPRLPPGRYLVKVYVDGRGKVARNWTTALDQADYVGQTEFQANWAEEYRGMTVVDAGKLRP